ncbi:MAG: DUF4384 domain-containing protein [Planctomycetaceae bacterium]|nr:DUF4384 domain-containing protein [Planctomycetaceae bacterium]
MNAPLKRLLRDGLLTFACSTLACAAWAQPAAEPAPPPAPAVTPEATPTAPPAASPAAPPAAPPGEVTAAENFATRFFVRVAVDRPSRDYRAGEQVKITVTSEIDAFAYVFYKQADGKVFLIFPNAEQRNNKLPAKQPVQIPAAGDNFRWEVSAPFGPERITVLAATEPLASLQDPRLRAELFNAVGAKQLKGVELELAKEKPAEWSIQHLDITTYDRAEPLAERPAKRFGVFFGVAEYLFNDEAIRASKEGRPLNLPTCAIDAEQLGIALKEMGEFDEVLLFTNEKATKRNLQEAVTRWLPSVTGPGDVCVIYFSGHGGQIPDLSGDEKPEPGSDNASDETLIPADYLGYHLYEKAEEEAQSGSLAPEKMAAVRRARELVGQFTEPFHKAMAMELATTITDDEFGNWLHQALDGRQIVVMLDSCHSGGFGVSAKGGLNEQKAESVKFDFLDQEIARLKDIGQNDTALFATCSPFQSVMVPKADDFPVRMSLMTYFVVQQLHTTQGSIDLEASFRNCHDKMAKYFADGNYQPTLPQLQLNLRKKVYLKP